MISFINSTNRFNMKENSDAIRNALIILIRHAIDADLVFSEKEKKSVLKLFLYEFNLNEVDTIGLLFNYKTDAQLEDATQELFELLQNDMYSRAKVIEFVSKVLASDGWVKQETPVFEEIRRILAKFD